MIYRPNLSSWGHLKIAGLFFVLGGCIELFMIKTGFYKVAVRNELERMSSSMNFEDEDYLKEENED